jgi:hypothetical protein
MPKKLDVTAAFGTYTSDEVAADLGRRGILRFPAGQPPEKFARAALNDAAEYSLWSAKYNLIEAPRDRDMAVRLFSNLEEIAASIKKLPFPKADTLLPIISFESGDGRPTDEEDQVTMASEATEVLRKQLGTIHSTIKDYLSSHAVEDAKSIGAQDPFSGGFIERMLWEQSRMAFPDIMVQPLQVRQIGPFARFLAAGWRDLSFPVLDHRGHDREPLERWFAGRLRILLAHRKNQPLKKSF